MHVNREIRTFSQQRGILEAGTGACTGIALMLLSPRKCRSTCPVDRFPVCTDTQLPKEHLVLQCEHQTVEHHFQQKLSRTLAAACHPVQKRLVARHLSRPDQSCSWPSLGRSTWVVRP